MHRNIRGAAIEYTATGKADNVVQEAERAVHGPVLIVDVRINMPAVGSGNYGGGRLEILFYPAAEFNVRQGPDLRPQGILEGQGHEQPGKLLKAFRQKRAAQHSRLMRQKLGFNALYAGRLLQR